MLSIILPLFLSLLLHIPAVQNFAVDRATRAVSRRLGTQVAIGRIDVGLLGKARVKGFYVEDYQHDTLLYVGSLDAYITGLGLSGGGIRIYRGELSGVAMNLCETPEGVMNIKQIVDSLSRRDRKKGGNFRLAIGHATIHDMRFRLRRLEPRRPEYGVDFGDIRLSEMNARMERFEIDGSAIGAHISSLSAVEQSGFRLNALSGDFYLNEGCIAFTDAQLLTERSNIDLPTFSLVGGSWDRFGDFIGEVLIDAELQHSTVASDDIAYFAPSLRNWHTDFHDADLSFSGTVSGFEGECRSLRTGRGTSLAGRFRIDGLPDIDRSHFRVDVTALRTTGSDIRRLVRNIGGQELAPSAAEMLANGGTFTVTGLFNGAPSDFNMNVAVGSGVGSAQLNLRVKPHNRRLRAVSGKVATRNLRLGRLLDSKLLGRMTASADINGLIGPDSADMQVVGMLSDFEVNGYAYDSLSLDGQLVNREFDGHAVSYDPNLRFDFDGMLDFNGEIPQYDFLLELEHADLQAIHVNTRDSVSLLSARIHAQGSGNDLDNLNGRVAIDNALYRYNEKEISSRRIVLQGENSDSSKYMTLRSDFADATFRSRTSYREIFDYMRLSMWKYLPMLSENRDSDRSHEMQAKFADAFTSVTVDLKNPTPIADALLDGLQIADNSEIGMLFNPATDRLSLRLTSDYFQHDRLLVTKIDFNAENPGDDSLNIYLATEDIYAAGFHLTSLEALGGAKHNRIQLLTQFADTTHRVSGQLGGRAYFAEGPQRRVAVRLSPSYFTRGDKTWMIRSEGILVDTARVAIRQLVMSNVEQELLVEGIASRSRGDSVTVRLTDFDLAPFAQFVENMGYTVEGRTNGYAVVKSALSKSEITADIRLDSVKINALPAPPMLLLSRWDFRENRAGITVSDRQTRDTLIRGFYDPAQVRYYAEMEVDGIQMKLLDPILKGVISDTSGEADARLKLYGQRRNASLQGEMRVRNLATTIDYMQVVYKIPAATVAVRDNRFTASGVPVFDTEGNSGTLDFALSLEHLSNIAYDMRIDFSQMLVLDTDEEDNDLFYGRVFASGFATIRGDKRGVRMDITAQTDDNTAFFMPLSSKSNISYADFVVFEKPRDLDTLDNLQRRKMQFANQRAAKTSEESDMEIAMQLNVRPNADFSLVIDPTVGDVMRGRGEGSLNLQIRPRSNLFEMYGDYTITEGSYLFTLQNIINKKFIIESGSTIQWTGKPTDALLNITAVYKLKASLQPLLASMSMGTESSRNNRAVPVDCIIYITDRLTSPDISFDVKVPNTDSETQTAIANTLNTETDIARQFVSLLAINSFYPENSATSSNIGAMISSATGLELLSNQLSNWLSSDDYNIIIRYRPKSELTSDEVDFGFSKSLIDNRLLVEVEGNYLLDNRQSVNNNMSNFMGEAYITWLIDRQGNLKLKGFTQTIDRFDENQGLQEHGIGIYYKEDFNNFSDLRRRIKARFTNRKRRARLAAQQDAATAGQTEEEDDNEKT